MRLDWRITPRKCEETAAVGLYDPLHRSTEGEVAMFIIWKGWGIVVLAIGSAALAAALIVAAIIGADYTASSVLLSISLVLAGVATWFVGKRMNRNAIRTLIDPATDQPVIIHMDHSMFFIRVEWWGPVLAALGVFWLFIAVLDR